MATSPPYAGSPPGSGAPISRKRPSLSSQITGAKRRKPSTAGPSHLRQTSFPPEEFQGGARSPSVDSAAIGTPSVISGVGFNKKRGKRAQSGSIINTGGSKVNGASRGASGSAVDGGGGGGGDEEPDDEDDDQQDALGNDEGDVEQRKREADAIIALKKVPTWRRHEDRYSAFQAVGNTMKPRIRKLANHTLSQSVPVSVVAAIASYSKVFLGEVIEEARRVQIEWQAVQERNADGSVIPDNTDLRERIKEEWRGPLTPDHLREAVRRIKKDKVGGASGFLGVSLQGKERSAPKMGGRKLFR